VDNDRVSSEELIGLFDSRLSDVGGYGLVLAVLCSGGFWWFAVVVEVVAEYLFEEYREAADSAVVDALYFAAHEVF
jgi:hypothetical protein